MVRENAASPINVFLVIVYMYLYSQLVNILDNRIIIIHMHNSNNTCIIPYNYMYMYIMYLLSFYRPTYM